jgi:hypothetical protein
MSVRAGAIDTYTSGRPPSGLKPQLIQWQSWRGSVSGGDDIRVIRTCALLTMYRYDMRKYASQKGLSAKRGIFSHSIAHQLCCCRASVPTIAQEGPE